jgi:hypothetical protein
LGSLAEEDVAAEDPVAQARLQPEVAPAELVVLVGEEHHPPLAARAALVGQVAVEPPGSSEMMAVVQAATVAEGKLQSSGRQEPGQDGLAASAVRQRNRSGWAVAYLVAVASRQAQEVVASPESLEARMERTPPARPFGACHPWTGVPAASRTFVDHSATLACSGGARFQQQRVLERQFLGAVAADDWAGLPPEQAAQRVPALRKGVGVRQRMSADPVAAEAPPAAQEASSVASGRKVAAAPSTQVEPVRWAQRPAMAMADLGAVAELPLAVEQQVVEAAILPWAPELVAVAKDAAAERSGQGELEWARRTIDLVPQVDLALEV